ncbi:MAG: hypothetical protein L6246_04015 [Thermodesulfovibrionales bacterium]|nr:hypothetical protein [Thermodesulfovibrionales bacterium]
MAFTVIVDGHNFINDLHRHGKDKDYIVNKLSFPHLHEAIQTRLKADGLYSHPFIHTEFICSDRKRIGDFKNQERDDLIKKLMEENGVTVREVEQHTKTKKRCNSEERAEQGIHVIIVGFKKDQPVLNEQLINESYLSLDLGELLDAMERMQETVE